MSLPSINRRARVSLTALAAGGAVTLGLTVLPANATAAPEAPPRTSVSVKSDQHAKADSITRAEMLRRAATWLTADNGAQVPYSQTSVWSDGYRQDCSGYVSMTLG
ncbi:MAG: hypothetical protein ACRDOV_07155, partial [Streptomyces sp.]